MSPYPYTIVVNGEQRVLTALLSGAAPIVVPGDHPNFDRIRDALEDGTAATSDIINLSDLSQVVATVFSPLSERVSVGSGRLYFDGDEVRSSIANHVLRAIDEGDEYQPLVRFMENVAANPNEHSREQLYDWLDAHDFTIDTDGNIVGYKGVRKNSDDSLVSGWSGTAIVDGVSVTGNIPNKVGSTIEMPRQSVQHDPSAACSRGLHVGTFGYAKAYASGAMLRVLVNPRDVVSVPTDAGGEKVRVCRYVVDAVIDAPETSAIFRSTESLDDPYNESEPEQVECYWCESVVDEDAGSYDFTGYFVCDECS